MGDDKSKEVETLAHITPSFLVREAVHTKGGQGWHTRGNKEGSLTVCFKQCSETVSLQAQRQVQS